MFEKSFRVVDNTGAIGTLRAPARFLDSRTEKVIELDNGGQLTVRAEELKVQQDGTFLLQRAPHHHETRVHAAEDATPNGTGPAATGVPQSAAAADQAPPPKVDEHRPLHRSTDVPAGIFYADDYDIERVPIDRVLDAPVESRHEGDTLILPVVEEVLVFQKKMLLKEEVRITRRRKAVEQVRRIEETGKA